MAKTHTIPWDMAKHLETPEDMAAYLEAALEENDPVLVVSVLSDIARAMGMIQIAREAGLPGENLSSELLPEGDLELATVLRIVKSLGLQLHAAVASR